MVGFSRIAAVFLSYAAVVTAYENTIYVCAKHPDKTLTYMTPSSAHSSWRKA